MAIGVLAREHGDIESVARLQVRQRLTRKRRIRRDLDLFEQQLHAACGRNFIEKIGHVRARENREQAAARMPTLPRVVSRGHAGEIKVSSIENGSVAFTACGRFGGRCSKSPARSRCDCPARLNSHWPERI